MTPTNGTAVDSGFFDAFGGPSAETISETPSEEEGSEEVEETEEVETPAETKKEKDDKGEGSKGTPDAEDDDEEESEEDEEEEAEEKEPEKKEEAKPVTAKKAITLKQGDEKIKIKPDATVLVPVDGKMQEVPLHEVLGSFSSKEARAREKTEVLTLRRETEEVQRAAKIEREEMQEFVKTFAAKAKDPQQVIPALAELLEPFSTDDSPLAIIRAIRNGILEQAQALLELSPEQRELLDLKEEVEWRRKAGERRAAKEQASSTEQQQVVLVKTVMEKCGIPDRTSYDAAASELAALVKAGKVQLPTVTPTAVGGFSVIKGLIQKVAPKLVNDQEALAEFVKVAIAVNPSREDMEAAIKAYAADSSGSESPASSSSKKRSQTLQFKPKAENRSGTKATSTRNLFL